MACSESLMEPINWILRALGVELPSYLRDTSDFIEHFSSIRIDSNSLNVFLTTLDVISLYTNIPHNKGLKALEHFLNQKNYTAPPTEFLINITSMLLYKNFFLFDNQYYLQKQGVAMGSRFSLDYTCLFLGYLKESYVWNNNPLCGHVTKTC